MRPRSLPLPPCLGCFRPGGLIALLVLLFTVAAPALRADGIVLPPVAAPAVTMPDQRALLVWNEKEQTETLVIESRFAGRGHDFAWVVPLPSKPEITPATRGTLPTLEALFRPAIASEWDFAAPMVVVLAPLALLWLGFGVRPFRWSAHFMSGLLGAAAAFVALLNLKDGVNTAGLIAAGILALLAIGLWKSAVEPSTAFLGAAFGVLLCIGAIPSFQKVRGISTGPVPAGVTIEHSLIGDYEVAVLSGESAGGITQWLRANNFAMPAAAEPVVAEHTRAGGFFAAVRLRRTEETAGPSAPAPLVFTFKTPQPVYPMKLTGAGATRPLEVELFVFGDARAEVDGLETLACAPVEFAESRPVSGKYFEPPNLTGKLTLSHPALRGLCAKTSVATHLVGTLAPGAMTRDLAIGWKPFRGSVGMVKYSHTDAAWRGLLAGTVVLVIAAAFSAWRWWGAAPHGWFAIGAVLLAGVVGSTGWAFFPTVEVVAGGKGRLQAGMTNKREFAMYFVQSVFELNPGEDTEARIREKFQRDHLAELKYPPTSLPREGDAPGEYRFRHLPDGAWRLVWIAENGQEVFWPDADVKPGAAP